MATTVALSDGDEALLSTVGQRVRVLRLEHVARLYGDHDEPRAHRRVGRLVAAGFLHHERFPSRPCLELAGPLTTWQAGLPLPDLRPIVAHCQQRFSGPVILTDCVFASQITRNRFACPEGRPSRMSEVTHDLHLAEVYLRMREELPARAQSWLSEEQVRKTQRGQSEKLPDALVKDGLYRTAIEFVGSSYRLEKLEAFHAYCAEAGFGYELW